MATFQDLYREFTQPKEFPIALYCPECKSSLSGYSCSVCKGNRKWLGAALDTIPSVILVPIAFCVPIFFGVIGALAFHVPGVGLLGFIVGLGASGILISDLRRERLTRRSSIAPERLLAQRYQDNPATYEQAAVCYLKWVTTTPKISAPEGFADFIRNYRRSANARTDLRTALSNAILAQVCGGSSAEDSWTPTLMDAAFIGSAEQESFLNAFIEAKELSGAHQVYVGPWRELIAKVELAHRGGMDLKGIDLRLPSGGWLIKQIRNGAALHDEIGAELMTCATESHPFCQEVARELVRLRWREGERVVSAVRKSALPFAQNVAKALDALKPSKWWQAIPALLLFVALPAFFAVTEGRAKKSGIEITAGVIFIALAVLGTFLLIRLDVQGRRRRQQLKRLLS